MKFYLVRNEEGQYLCIQSSEHLIFSGDSGHRANIYYTRKEAVDAGYYITRKTGEDFEIVEIDTQAAQTAQKDAGD